jgi:hypothetical protein
MREGIARSREQTACESVCARSSNGVAKEGRDEINRADPEHQGEWGRGKWQRLGEGCKVLHGGCRSRGICSLTPERINIWPKGPGAASKFLDASGAGVLRIGHSSPH